MTNDGAGNTEIVDAHIHLFEFGNGADYLLSDLDGDVASSGHAVSQAVYVECGSGYRTDGPQWLRPVGETESVAAAIEAARGSGVDIAGIVGFADLSGPDLDQVLDAHEVAGRSRFRGIRQATAYDEDQAVPRLPQRPPPDLMDRDEFRAGLSLLGERGLTYDAYLFHPQLAQLAAAARAAPDTTIILDHVGAPLSIGPYAGRRSEVMAAWRDGMNELSECPNVVVKLGGIGMASLGFGLEESRASGQAPSSQQIAEAWSPVVGHVLTVFGADRCMAESNFPVDRRTGSYRTVWDAIILLLNDLSQDAKRTVLAETARRIYRL